MSLNFCFYAKGASNSTHIHGSLIHFGLKRMRDYIGSILFDCSYGSSFIIFPEY